MPALKDLLKARQLPRGGNKAQLVAQLHKSDQKRMPDVLPPACTAPLTPPFAIDANLSILESSFQAGFSKDTPDDDRMNIDDDEGDSELEIGEDGSITLRNPKYEVHL
jgi:hypothetical protein